MKERYDVDVAGLTTFGVAGRAACLVEWESVADLDVLGDVPQPVLPIGGGSNLLFTRPFEGTLLRCAAPAAVDIDGLRVTAPASVTLDALCEATSRRGLRGIENLSGIPGTLGGAIVQNAGAYGAEISDCLLEVTLYDLAEKRTLTVSRQWLAPAYRHTALKDTPWRYVVVNATFVLHPGDAPAKIDYGNLRQTLSDAEPTPMAVRLAVLAMRGSKLPDPAVKGSAGSFFRNPEVATPPEGAPAYPLPNGLYKVPAAWLIDRCGLKGARCGGAMVWPQQPLVIVNDGSAKAGDILKLEHLIVQTVHERFGITLTPEVEHV